VSTLPRPSFRQLLLVAFLLLAGFLGVVALRGQVALERLLESSRAGAERTLQLSADAERLAEQGRTMERAARQFLVLGDPALRGAYTAAADQAAAHVRALEGAVAAPLQQQWQERRQLIERQFAGAPALGAAAATRDATLVTLFGELELLHGEMAEQVRAFTEARNAELQAEVADGRLAVGRLLAASLVLAGVLALALALGLSLPLRRVEAAIVALGENRLAERIGIPGPSDVRQIGRRLDWLRQRLAGLDADKARFLRHVSHELKTPLAALREGVALLQDGVAGPLSADQREVARILHDNTAALQHRIEDLLRFNEAAFAAQRLVRRPTELAALVRGVIDEQALLWRGRGLQIDLHGGPLKGEVDADLLRSAVANLLANAIRYSPRNATINIELQRAGDGLQLEVADEGPGVAAEDRERIFEPFFRGQTQPGDGQLPGTGIGLSIVAETVAAHGGRVSLVANAPGERGARFRIELPHALAD
jgi:two-component system, NtrC family, sensor histidine kinase GlrK